MGNALQYKCQSCRQRTSHPAVKTDPQVWRLERRHSKMLQALYGQEVLYRTRDRQCSHCGDVNKTTEMLDEHVGAMLAEIDRLNGLLDRHIEQQGVAFSPHFPGVVSMLREITFEQQWHYDPRITWQQADEILEGVSAWLKEIEPELASFVRYRYKLWDAPRAEDLPEGLTTQDVLSKLRHPSRSQVIADYWNMLWPIENHDADAE